ncbi:MAG: biotin--[acetyl-CoA-carboxylase] ligase [Moorea sp. SIO3I7]|uniref:biotin--[acetyl-CoA-carboxylase] ligase n=1 Tax=unclassified Moorena TaxID=2683338 RepID=UPI0013C29D31|nr:MULTISPECIES: biotin--[acetyl-CoA-carboxylase] ligase [unclassified Moorena]NEN96556.1 biotin--[acetyl-CoA-carboxylase] ligase [Moorena sp. SIO3I7]NEO09720.1 biotin--[acetyl-CoA-carboxylase] ligase [Moorena sp. SIO3I8]NEP22184.1 biotin--[acetyl-CoA-carboxylase] ligase [Moorena sp. SIO3I6]
MNTSSFNQQAFEIALEAVREQLPLNSPGMGKFSPIPLQVFDTLPSTNQTLWELLNQGATVPSMVIAGQQTAGRGQWGRQWQSPKGGLYLSLALAPKLQALDSAQLTMCSAWGIATALRAYAMPVSLKWPNDLLLKGRKLGGILTQTRVQQGQITKAVVGVGINWSNEVPESGINLCSFWQPEPSPTVTSIEMLAAIVLQGLLSGYQLWSEEGMNSLLPRYLALFNYQGSQVMVEGNPGIITGVTPRGELRVHLHDTPTPKEILLKPGTISLGYRSC